MEESQYIDNFAAKEEDRIIGTKNNPGESEYFQLITAEPLYFDVTIPRAFPKATVSLTYQNPDQQREIMLGVRQPNGIYFFEDLAYDHPALEKLDDFWVRIQEDDLILWQKNNDYFQQKVVLRDELQNSLVAIDDEYNKLKRTLTESESADKINKAEEANAIYKRSINELAEENSRNDWAPPYASIQDFFENFPDPDRVLQYNFDLSPYLELPGYEKSNETIQIDNSIRGGHDIYTYIGENEDLNFTFWFQDINRHEGEDLFSLNVYNSRGEKIHGVTLPDDGVVDDNGKVFDEKMHQLLLEKIPLGVYRIEISINDDIFIKNFETFQHLFMFKRKLYLTDNEEYRSIIGNKDFTPTTIYTTSNTVKALTSHESGKQVLRVGSEDVLIDKTHTEFELVVNDGITRIISPKNDLLIRGNGFFALSESQLFDPNFSSVGSLEIAKSTNDYDFIIAKYPQAEQEGDWLVASATVEAPELYLSKNGDYKGSFMIHLPDLPETKRTLKVKEVSILFEKDPITLSNVFDKIKGWISR